MVKRPYRASVDVELDLVDREALSSVHIGWSRRSGAYFYADGQQILLHRWVYDRMLTEEMIQNGWDQPRLDLCRYNIHFKDGNKKNCRRDNLYCDSPVAVEQLQQTQTEQPRCNLTHGSLPCKKAPCSIIVRAEDYAGLVDKHLSWSRGRGAYFYEGDKCIYVHRYVFEKMCREELWYAELSLLSKSYVGFIDGDMTYCDRDNLFLWSCDSADQRTRQKAKEQARLRAIEWHKERHQLRERWEQEELKNADKDRV